MITRKSHTCRAKDKIDNISADCSLLFEIIILKQPFEIGTRKQSIYLYFRDVTRNNAPGLRRILVRIQGALRGAYSLSVPLNATQNTGQKTSKMGALFLATSLSHEKNV